MDNMKHRRLQELKRSDFEIAEHQPDIRGWEVKDEAGHRLGKVKELIVDARQKKVRYMVVDTGKNDFKLEDRKVLIPIGMAELHSKDDDVIVPGITASQIEQIPDYDEDHLDGSTEQKICRTLGRKEEYHTQYQSGMDADAEFYQHDYYNDDRLYRHRLHEQQNQQKPKSEYEKGLHLWEKRSEGGILPDAGTQTYRKEEKHSYKEEEEPMHVRHQREQQQREQRDMRHLRNDESRHNRHNTIEDRIRREGLRDPDER